MSCELMLGLGLAVGSRPGQVEVSSGVNPNGAHLSISAAAKKGSDFVMIAEERNEQLGATVLKNKAQTAITAALKQFVPQFAYAETAVHVRLAVALGEVAESQETFHPFALRKLPQASEDRRVDGEKLIQASL